MEFAGGTKCVKCSAGTAGSKGECSACPAGKFQPYEGRNKCFPQYPACQPGTFEAQQPSAKTARKCSPCAKGLFTAVAGERACSPQPECVESTYVAQEGGAASKRACGACPPGRFTTTRNAAACSPWEKCAPGFADTAGAGPALDRTCEPCDNGFFSTGSKDVAAVKTTTTTGTTATTVTETSTTRTKARDLLFLCPHKCKNTEEMSAITTGLGCFPLKFGACTRMAFLEPLGLDDFLATDSGAPPALYWKATPNGAVASAGYTVAMYSSPSCQTSPFNMGVSLASVGVDQTVPFKLSGSVRGTAGNCNPLETQFATVNPKDKSLGAIVAQQGKTRLRLNFLFSLTCEPNKNAPGTLGACSTAPTAGPGAQRTTAKPLDISAQRGEAEICTQFRTCQPGQYVVEAPTSSSNRVCATCPGGQFSASGSAMACAPTAVCQAGEYASVAPTASSDRACATCPGGQFAAAQNADRCGAQTDCKPGEYVGDTGACTTCRDGTFTARANEAQCAPWTRCPVGVAVATAGTSSSDAACARPQCPAGQVAVGETCVSPSDCKPGTHVESGGGDTGAKRECASCPPGHYSAGVNKASCTKWSACRALGVATPGTPITNQKCNDCPAGTKLVPPRTCAPCPEGQFTVSANQPTCVAARTCPEGTGGSVLEPTLSSDRHCGNDRRFLVCPKACPGAAADDTQIPAALLAHPCLSVRENVCTELALADGVFSINEFAAIVPADTNPQRLFMKAAADGTTGVVRITLHGAGDCGADTALVVNQAMFGEQMAGMTLGEYLSGAGYCPDAAYHATCQEAPEYGKTIALTAWLEGEIGDVLKLDFSFDNPLFKLALSSSGMGFCALVNNDLSPMRRPGEALPASPGTSGAAGGPGQGVLAPGVGPGQPGPGTNMGNATGGGPGANSGGSASGTSVGHGYCCCCCAGRAPPA